MTKKDYELIAEVIRRAKWLLETEDESILLLSITNDFINALKKENPKFDKIKFNEYINKDN